MRRYNAGMIRVLIVGSGDIAQRVLPTIVHRFRVYALLRDPGKAAWWRQQGVCPIIADLDQRSTLGRLRGLAHWILHFAPPGTEADSAVSRGADAATDSRTRHLIAALSSRGSLPQRLLYISTTGVYGPCAGAHFDETRKAQPATARAGRRLDAEQRLRRWAGHSGVRLTILRVPGIYAEDRLPLQRLKARTPVLRAADDVFTNHIHADDLAQAVWQGVRRGKCNRVYHVVDDAEMLMGDYFDHVADAFSLERPPRVSREDAERCIPAAMLSFMSESRRLDNRRMKMELGVRLAWPRVDAAVRVMGRNRAASGV